MKTRSWWLLGTVLCLTLVGRPALAQYEPSAPGADVPVNDTDRAASAVWRYAGLLQTTGVAGDILRRQLARELVAASGVARRFDRLPAVYRQAVRERVPELDPADEARLADVLTRAYQPDAVSRTLAEAMVAEFDVVHAVGLVTWLASPFGRRVVALSEAASSPGAVQEAQAFAGALDARELSPGRVALLGRLDAAARTTEAAVESRIAFARSMLEATAALQPSTVSFLPSRLEQQVKDLRPRLEAEERGMTLANHVFTYRGVSDAELEQVVRVAESDAGKWFARLTIGTLAVTAAAAGRDVAPIVVDANLKRDLRSLIRAEQALAARFEALPPREVIADEAEALKRDLAVFETRYALQLTGEQFRQTVDLALGVGRVLTTLLDLWGREQAEARSVRGLEGALEEIRTAVTADAEDRQRVVRAQHRYNLAVSRDRLGDLRRERAMHWERLTKLLAELRRRG